MATATNVLDLTRRQIEAANDEVARLHAQAVKMADETLYLSESDPEREAIWEARKPIMVAHDEAEDRLACLCLPRLEGCAKAHGFSPYYLLHIKLKGASPRIRLTWLSIELALHVLGRKRRTGPVHRKADELRKEAGVTWSDHWRDYLREQKPAPTEPEAESVHKWLSVAGHAATVNPFHPPGRQICSVARTSDGEIVVAQVGADIGYAGDAWATVRLLKDAINQLTR